MRHQPDDLPGGGSAAPRAPSGPCRCRASGGRGTPSGSGRSSATASSSRASRASRDLPVRAAGPITRMRGVEKSGRSTSASGDRRGAERGRAGAERRAGDVDRSVPVAVRLHDRPELGAVERAQQRPRVPADRAQVDRSAQTGASITRVRRDAPDHVATRRSAPLRDRRVGAAAVAGDRPGGRRDPGVHPLREERATITPVSTSPVPAVASDGVPERGDEDALSRRGDERVRPLSRQTQPNRSAASRTAASRCAATQAELAAEQPRRARPRAGSARSAPSRVERLEAEERIGVDDRRQVGLLEQPPHERRFSAEPARARGPTAERDSWRSTRASSASSSGRFTASSRCGSTSGADGHVAGVGAEGGRRGQRDRTGHARASRRRRARRRRCTCCRVSRLRGTRPSTSRRDQPVLGLAVLEPDVGDDDLAGVEPARRDLEPDLAAVHRHGHVGAAPRAPAISPVSAFDAGGQVDRDDRHAGGVDRLDQRAPPPAAARRGSRCRTARRSARRRSRPLGRLRPGGAQHLERDPAVAAVRAAAAHRAERPRVRDSGAAPPRRPPARRAPSASARRGPASAALHLLGRVEGVKHRRRTPPRRARASASSRDRALRAHPLGPRRRRGPRAAPTASAGPRSRRRATRTRARPRSRSPSRPPPCRRTAPRSAARGFGRESQ